MGVVEFSNFQVNFPDDFTCWFESESETSTNSIQFSRSDGLEGLFEVIGYNKYEDLAFVCEQSIINEVDSMAGYVDEIDEEYPLEIVTIIEDSEATHSHRHFFRYYHCLAFHLTLVRNYDENDHKIARNILNGIVVKDGKWTTDNPERIEMKFSTNSKFDKVGLLRFVIDHKPLLREDY